MCVVVGGNWRMGGGDRQSELGVGAYADRLNRESVGEERGKETKGGDQTAEAMVQGLVNIARSQP